MICNLKDCNNEVFQSGRGFKLYCSAECQKQSKRIRERNKIRPEKTQQQLKEEAERNFIAQFGFKKSVISIPIKRGIAQWQS